MHGETGYQLVRPGGFKLFFNPSLTHTSPVCCICGTRIGTCPYRRMLCSTLQQWMYTSERGDGDRLGRAFCVMWEGWRRQHSQEAGCMPPVSLWRHVNHRSNWGCKLVPAANKAKEEIPLIILRRAWLKEVREVGVQGEGQGETHFCHVWEQSYCDMVVACLSISLASVWL